MNFKHQMISTWGLIYAIANHIQHLLCHVIQLFDEPESI